MKLKRIAATLLVLTLLLQPPSAAAFETDQYTLPPEPLADIGDEVSEYVEQNVRTAVDRINREILLRRKCLEEKTREIKCGAAEKERARLEFLRTEKAVARGVYELLGTGIPPFTSSGSWLESHRFKAQPARYRTGLWKSIYLTFPLDYVGIGSTVNIYGEYFGTDKVAHFFQQGYSYYRIYTEALGKGEAPDKAARKAVEWGQKTERTYYGALLTGVYSNGDLAANYAGMKFYLGLTREVRLGAEGGPKPPILSLKDGVWSFNENPERLREVLLKPFVSPHFNEALNPSIFTPHFGLRSFVRRSVRRRGCATWLRHYPQVSRADFQNLTEALKRWRGEDYGFTPGDDLITIANTCFGEAVAAAGGAAATAGASQ